MKHNYIIVDDSHESILNTQATAMRFQNLSFMGYASNYDDALNLILEHQPSLLFLEINPLKKESNLSLNLINELYRYLTVVPKIIITTKDQSLVFRAMEYGVADYLVKPLDLNAFRKAILKIDKTVSQNTIPTPVVPQQTVPQQALTFADFLRQEPIDKGSIKKEVEPIVETQEEQVETIIEEETIAEITVVDAAHENPTLENNEVVTKETSETETSETEVEASEEIVEEPTAPNEETPTEEILETDEETTVTEEIDLETEALEPNEAPEVVEETILEEIIESEEVIAENNTDEEITILPVQKVIVEQEKPLVICIKSYGDYRYIDSRDIIYFEADNNSVDIHLKDGELVTSFKTLKIFESLLPETQFLRIHNSYIININHVARIHTGNSLCYIKNSTVKLPFSKSYKENVELIIHRIASGNYLEF